MFWLIFRFNNRNNLTCLTSSKRQSRLATVGNAIRGEVGGGGLENRDRHELRSVSPCIRNINIYDGRGAILQGYTARSIVNPIK